MVRRVHRCWTRPDPRPQPFRLEEATIDDLHQAIRSGAATVVAVVQHYLARVRAYNGVASMLVTEDGAPVPAATGAVRAGAPLRFPTQTVKASTILPDLDKYKGRRSSSAAWRRPPPTPTCSSSSA